MRSEARDGAAPRGLTIAAWSVVAFLHLPVLVIVLYAFTSDDRTYTFPPPGLTVHWFAVAASRLDMWAALRRSLAVAAAATSVALVLGTLLSLAIARARFRARDALTLLITLPIALPGIITGIALLSAISLTGIERGFWSVALGHATFCIVIVYNNVVARLRRIPRSWTEASQDLGASAWQTFRQVLAPHLATAWLAGGMLAFALSFDEIIVTLFTAGHEPTLPIWFYNELFRPRNRPVTNVVAIAVVAVTVGPILLAYRLTRPSDDRVPTR
jgi:putative spermidine/putrescine transport system permease protein